MLNTSKSDVDEATRLLDKSFSEVGSCIHSMNGWYYGFVRDSVSRTLP